MAAEFNMINKKLWKMIYLTNLNCTFIMKSANFRNKLFTFTGLDALSRLVPSLPPLPVHSALLFVGKLKIL